MNTREWENKTATEHRFKKLERLGRRLAEVVPGMVSAMLLDEGLFLSVVITKGVRRGGKLRPPFRVEITLEREIDDGDFRNEVQKQTVDQLVTHADFSQYDLPGLAYGPRLRVLTDDAWWTRIGVDVR